MTLGMLQRAHCVYLGLSLNVSFFSNIVGSKLTISDYCFEHPYPKLADETHLVQELHRL